MKNNKKDASESEQAVELDENLIPVEDNLVEDESIADEDASQMEDTIEILMAEIQKLREDYLRAFADAENTKKRCALEIEKNSKYAISSFAKSLLSVADNLHRAITAVDAEHHEACDALLKGVELTQAELMKAFNKFGITKMEIMDQVFDPNYHQVIQEVENKEKPAGTIIAELQSGYMINDRILREAMVVVTKK